MGTAHSFPTVGQTRAAALAASIAKLPLELTAAIHPVLARTDTADLDLFVDTPSAHRQAERDFRRSRRIEKLIEIAAARDTARRLAELAWA